MTCIYVRRVQWGSAAIRGPNFLYNALGQPTTSFIFNVHSLIHTSWTTPPSVVSSLPGFDRCWVVYVVISPATYLSCIMRDLERSNDITATDK